METMLTSLIDIPSLLTLASAVPASVSEPAHGAAVGAAQVPQPWVALIPMLPIFGVIIAGVCAIFDVRTKLPAFLTVGCLAGSFLLTLAVFLRYDSFNHGDPFVVHLFDWINLSWGDPSHPTSFAANFSFYIDKLTVLWMLFVTGLAALIALYASEYMSHDVGRAYCRFFVGFNLFVFSMACLVMGDNLVLLYLGWEGVGLCSYLLIGYFYKKPAAVAAAKKAFIVNRIGDLGLALGIYLTFVHFGTVQYSELFASDQLQGYLTAAGEHRWSDIPMTAQGIALLLLVGAIGKSAQFPLYVWLPDAMEGPTPVSALIHAATMVTAGVFLIARAYPLFLISEFALPTVAWVGTITALLAATIGMAQFDIKRIMAYSTVSQLGYMFAGLGVLTTTGAAFHVLTHAFFKALLFLCCGAVMHGFAGQLDLRKLSGVAWMKGWGIVAIGMLVGCLNLSGFAFTAGFFSKDMILAEAFVTPGYSILGWILIGTAGLTAYYTFRVFFRVFLGPQHAEPGDEHHDDHAEQDHTDETDDHHTAAHGHAAEHGGRFHPHPPGWAINTVLVILAIGSILAAGLYFIEKDSHGWVGAMINDSSASYHSPYADHADVAHAEEGAHTGLLFGQDPHQIMYYVSGVVGLIGILLAAILHGPRGWQGLFLGGRTEAGKCRMDSVAKLFGPIPRWAEDKWYVDELYIAIFQTPLRVFAHLFHLFDKFVIDAIVDGVAKLPGALASALRPSQSGQLQGYAAGMAGGMVVLLIIVLVVIGGAS